jgi:CubicO group peptidase (beta-lactamase class C family)
MFRSLPRRPLLLTALLLFIAPVRAEEAEPKWRQGLDDLIAETMKEWQVPGLAVAVVKDGKVVLSKGYGLRDVEKKRPVTPRSLFAIGSITKSFTVSGLGMLADEKKLDWDRSVRDYLPDFRLHEKLSADRVTPRDLVTHRTGLPRHDSLWYVTRLGQRELYDRLRHLEPSQDLRALYQYNNLAYLTAGLLEEKIAGESWESFTRKRILAPLGMSRTNFSVVDSQKSDDFAVPYREHGGKVRPMALRDIAAVAPAGAINSCVEDMSRYLLFHIEQGKYAGKQLLSTKMAEEMQAPQMVIPLSVQKLDKFVTPGDSSYGLGFVVSRHRKEKMIAHGGSIDGFIAYFAFLPEHRTGVVVLSNLWRRNGNPVPIIVAHEIFDRLLGRSGIDWRERGRKQIEETIKKREERQGKSAKERKPGTSPTHPLEELVGTYEHPAHGQVRVEAAGKNLKLHFSAGRVLAKHYQYNTFEIVETEELPAVMLEERKLTFLPGKKGVIDRVQMEMEAGVRELIFRRVEKQGDPSAKRSAP